jgi:serine protease AprX
MGTASLSNDLLGAYSSHGPGNGKVPDFAAPGSHAQGLRVPNSFLDAHHPEGMLDSRYFRGSGTSQAAAVISGAIALILQKYPTLTPDKVKKFLASSAYKLSKVDADDQGAGEIQLLPMLTKTPAAFTQSFPAATGTGSVEASRGTDHLTANGVVLTGEKDIWGHLFNSAAMAVAEAAGNSWSGGTWNGNSWSGNSWSANSWSGNSWSGNSWSGNSWSGNSWSGNSWSGNSWSGNSWSGNSWSGSSWSGNSWSTGSWN